MVQKQYPDLRLIVGEKTSGPKGPSKAPLSEDIKILGFEAKATGRMVTVTEVLRDYFSKLQRKEPVSEVQKKDIITAIRSGSNKDKDFCELLGNISALCLDMEIHREIRSTLNRVSLRLEFDGVDGSTANLNGMIADVFRRELERINRPDGQPAPQ